MNSRIQFVRMSQISPNLHTAKRNRFIERRMNCLFITAGGRKVRVFELVSCSDCAPIPPTPLPPWGEGGGDYRSISDVVLFRLHLNNLTLLLLQKTVQR
jgi:hypothetical protein